MSLKAFHIFFVGISTLLSVGFGFWSLRLYLHSGDGADLALGVGAFVGSAVLVSYGAWILRKLRGVSYL
ncbi:MAG: hypothetical protein QGI83_12700 [Candidatus Latescibacteria bacterium]|jgi:hypothetical protein|nr:hypothetical protein [Candidatus Latescibacterota bacterium]